MIESTGAPRGSIYHHFPGGKAQLAGEAVDYVGSLARGAIEASLNDDDPIAAQRAFVELWRADFERSGHRAGCPIVAVAVENHDEPPELLDAAARAFERWRTAFAASLSDAGVPPERATRLATLVVSAVEGAIVLSRAQRDPARWSTSRASSRARSRRRCPADRARPARPSGAADLGQSSIAHAVCQTNSGSDVSSPSRSQVVGSASVPVSVTIGSQSPTDLPHPVHGGGGGNPCTQAGKLKSLDAATGVATARRR